MCKEIQSILTITGFTPYCFADYAPVCGNGVVENGEQCDDMTACCNNNCQLVGQCTPGANGANTCCSSSCKFQPTTTACNNGMGYCANGKCQDAICSGYGLPYCGQEPGGCKVNTRYSPSTLACSKSGGVRLGLGG
jgi:hypothetical protein